jgi:predicted deacylase
MGKRSAFKLDGEIIPRGRTRDVRLKISESYTGAPVEAPVRVQRARQPGPTVFVSAAIHGNEINGIGIVHELMYERPIELAAGTLILLPVVNVFGVEYQDRYMPDRRDLNRNFPGSTTGSLTRRIARLLFREVVAQCDFGIDLHSAADTRTNFPNVRGDLTDPAVRRIAEAFGCELVVHGQGPTGSLRREACAAGCPTIILEAGEPRKIEPRVLEIGYRGVRNVLVELGMAEGERHRPAYQTRVDRTRWVRAQVGGILRFHVAPGSLVEQGEPVATNTSLYGGDKTVLVSPVDGVVLGMTTLPTVKPGEPVCHIAVPELPIASVREALESRGKRSLHEQIQVDLATNVHVTPPGDV